MIEIELKNQNKSDKFNKVRPKYINELSKYNGEGEYLMNCFSTLKIKDIKNKTEKKKEFTEYKTEFIDIQTK